MPTQDQNLELPTAQMRAARWCPPGAVLADARLVVQGVSLPWRRLGESGPLPGDGPSQRTDVSCVCVTPPREVLETLAPGIGLILVDDESRPVAALEGIRIEGDTISGSLRAAACASADTGLRHPDTATEIAPSGGRRLGVVLARPPMQADLEAVRRWRSTVADGEVLWLVGSANPTPDGLPPAVVMRGVKALSDGFSSSRVLGCSLWWRDSERDSVLAAHVAAAHGVTDLLLLDADAYPMHAAPWLEHSMCATAGGADWHRLLSAIRAGTTLPPRTPAALASVLRRWYPPRASRGLVVLFTGYSGSGKSTVAHAVVHRIAEESLRTVTLLDGDIVRTMLSAGLGFDRAGRDTNVRRIGFVASEVARHGGIAVCAPIAPYAQSRRAVREMAESVGDFVLVHVSTPLEVCEGRDLKGLYARARAGLVHEFTGVSDPYEPPADADVTIDTSVMTESDAVSAVFDFLRRGGWLVPGSEG